MFVACVLLQVVTTWEEHVEIETQDNAHLEIWRDHEGVHVVDKLSAKEVAFTARIPQRFNCLIRGAGCAHSTGKRHNRLTDSDCSPVRACRSS